MHKGNFLTIKAGSLVCLIGFLLLAYSSNSQQIKGPPNNQDCLGAIPVCQPVYSTTTSYTGHGNVYPEIHDNSLCPLCMDGEKNDVFYIITVQTNGILRFTLTPNNSSNDYDWSVFNMTNADCSQLYPQAVALQVSCNSYGNVGYNGPTGISTALGNGSNCNGPGIINGPSFNKDLNVFAGETYLINISNWSSTNQAGYTLDFSSSTATIFDDVPPVIDSIQDEIPCSGADSIYVRFSENVMCNDVFHHPENFSLTGPGGPVLITDVTSPDCGTGAHHSPFVFLKLDTLIVAGSYTLGIVGDIRDLCSNVALYNTYPFQLIGINAPVADAGNDTTVANGSVITLHGSAVSGTPPLSYHWEPAALLVDPDVPEPVTINMGSSTGFILRVTDNLGCIDEDEVMVTVLGGPLGVITSALPELICVGEQVQLQALGTGGSGNYSFTWSSNPAGFSSALPNPVVFPPVTTTYQVSIADGFSTCSGSVTVHVDPLPVANAGPDVSIPFGTTTMLNGSASGGSDSYTWLWTSNPPGFYSTQQQPVTPNLSQTTLFSLIATDAGTGCVSLTDDMIVSVTGSPLSVSPVAMPPVICQGVATRLIPMTGGGAGSYTYQWVSEPPGFSSVEPGPLVMPDQTTIYFVTVSDGYNQTSGSVTVVVNPSPVIDIGPADTTVCIYDSLLLDAGNPGSAYYWSNGATGQTIRIGSAGIGYEVQTYSVKVINQHACVDSASITVVFSFAACTGTNDQTHAPDVLIYPNPTTGDLSLSVKGMHEPMVFTILNLMGCELIRQTINLQDRGDVTTQVDISDLPAGIYLVRITSLSGSVVRKLIVE